MLWQMSYQRVSEKGPTSSLFTCVKECCTTVERTCQASLDSGRAFIFQLAGFRPFSTDASAAVIHLYDATRTTVLKVAISGCLLRSSHFVPRIPSNAKAGAWLAISPWFPPGLDQAEGTSCVPVQS